MKLPPDGAARVSKHRCDLGVPRAPLGSHAAPREVVGCLMSACINSPASAVLEGSCAAFLPVRDHVGRSPPYRAENKVAVSRHGSLDPNSRPFAFSSTGSRLVRGMYCGVSWTPSGMRKHSRRLSSLLSAVEGPLPARAPSNHRHPTLSENSANRTVEPVGAA